MTANTRRKVVDNVLPLRFAMERLEELAGALREEGHTRSAKVIAADAERIRQIGLHLADLIEKLS